MLTRASQGHLLAAVPAVFKHLDKLVRPLLTWVLAPDSTLTTAPFRCRHRLNIYSMSNVHDVTCRSP